MVLLVKEVLCGFAVVDKSPKVIYAATASGGLWKTVNCTSWNPIFDNENIISIEVAVDHWSQRGMVEQAKPITLEVLIGEMVSTSSSTVVKVGPTWPT